MDKIKIMTIFGTRPEAVKMAPVIKELNKYPRLFQVINCVSGQHRHMLDQVLSIFDIKPDTDLNIMRKNQSLSALTSRALGLLTQSITAVKPRLILVQGDTTTAMAAALAGFYQKIPIGHIEAGLRTRDKYNPFPEELNRHIISVLAAYHFAPTATAVQSLIQEGIPKEHIFLTGNTVVDALKMIIKKSPHKSFVLPEGKKIILVTAHRRENFGGPLKNICGALKRIARRNADVEIIYPVHLNPNVQNTVYKLLASDKRIHLVHPIEYHQLAFLLKKVYLVLTDSGGIQEEAPTFGKPVLVLREETERPEGIKAGVAKLVGTNEEKIVAQTEMLLRNAAEYKKMSKSVSPYGDGKAARRIVSIIKKITTKGV